jgi:hypothetical protein
MTIPVNSASGPVSPPKRPVPPLIDPKKFIPGGEHIEKLKGLLRDVDEFTGTVKEKGKKLDETLDMFDKAVLKFSDVVERLGRVVEKMEDANGQGA